MEKEYLVLFGTVIGFLGSLLVTFLNNKQQIKKVRLENEHNIRLEELKIVTSIKKDQLRELLPKLEEAAALVRIPLISATHSEGSRPPIPIEAGHSFRRIPAMHSGRSRPRIPIERGHLFRSAAATFSERSDAEL
jgi:hypothetical protein